MVPYFCLSSAPATINVERSMLMAVTALTFLGTWKSARYAAEMEALQEDAPNNLAVPTAGRADAACPDVSLCLGWNPLIACSGRSILIIIYGGEPPAICGKASGGLWTNGFAIRWFTYSEWWFPAVGWLLLRRNTSNSGLPLWGVQHGQTMKDSACDSANPSPVFPEIVF